MRALPLLVLSIVWIDSATTATWADQEPLWTYNDSSCTWSARAKCANSTTKNRARL